MMSEVLLEILRSGGGGVGSWFLEGGLRKGGFGRAPRTPLVTQLQSMLAWCGNAPPMQRNWTWHWMKPAKWSQDVWSRQIPTVCPYSPESPHQTSGERWQVVRNGHGKLRTNGIHSMDISEWLSPSTRLRNLPAWSYGENDSSPWTPDCILINNCADEHLPTGADNPWTTNGPRSGSSRCWCGKCKVKSSEMRRTSTFFQSMLTAMISRKLSQICIQTSSLKRERSWPSGYGVWLGI